MMLWIHPEDAPKGPDDYCKFVCAELPDPIADPVAHEMVKKHMIHGPCDSLGEKNPPINPDARCLTKGLTNKKCEKQYPKPFAKSYSTGANNEPIYQRRSSDDGGFTGEQYIKDLKKTVKIDNSSVVPYNRVIILKYNAHINIEICSSHGGVKYLFKYIHKGSDRVMIETADGTMVCDEISSFRNARYIAASEALWKLFEFKINYMEPSVQKLALHLPNEQSCVFPPDADLVEVLARNNETHLTAFFRLNQEDVEANNILYFNILKHYSWDQKNKCFKKRKNNLRKNPSNDTDAKSDCIGRIPVISMNTHNEELYFLRLLLHNVPGPKSYEDLRTVEVDGQSIVCPDFHTAAVKLGLFEDNEEIIKSLKEAANYKFAKQFRSFFACIILFCMPADKEGLFQEFKVDLCEDYMKDAEKKGFILNEPTDDMVNKARLHLHEMFTAAGKDMAKDFKMVAPIIVVKEKTVAKILQEEIDNCSPELAEKAIEAYSMMNDEQQLVYNSIVSDVESHAGSLFVIDAPGGTGKTYVMKAILNNIRGSGNMIINVQLLSLY